MRYDTPVYFQLEKQGEYDQATGNYAEGELTETKAYASVADAGAETARLVYGKLKQKSKVVQLQNHYKKAFNRIRIGDSQYRVDFERELRTKHIFVVSEVT